jgi:hypothetical protein
MVRPNRSFPVIALVPVDTDGLLEVVREVVEPVRVDH